MRFTTFLFTVGQAVKTLKSRINIIFIRYKFLHNAHKSLKFENGGKKYENENQACFKKHAGCHSCNNDAFLNNARWHNFDG